MTKIERLIAQSETEMRRAAGATTAAEKDRHVMRAERLLDEAWRLNEADASLPPFDSGLWCNHAHASRRAA